MEEPAAQFPPNHLLAASVLGGTSSLLQAVLEEPAAQFPPNHLLARITSLHIHSTQRQN
ncbi:MAG: hypothetical protein HYW48_09180 [Deltaproteobacteria bacterium]|nr:hypothetical protein [Deltaproteobacteria bacterium]